MIKNIGRTILSVLLLAALVGLPACSGAETPETTIDRLLSGKFKADPPGAAVPRRGAPHQSR